MAPNRGAIENFVSVSITWVVENVPQLFRKYGDNDEKQTCTLVQL